MTADRGPGGDGDPRARGGIADEGLAAGVDAAPEEVVALYDSWATGYDDDLDRWGYDAPDRVARAVVDAVGRDRLVLDAGCGTGRAGAALRELGVERIVGGDVSSESVAVARGRGPYESVEVLDLNAPLAHGTDRFGAAVSVGVFTYLTDTEATVRELLRVVEPGGVVVFTQRTDVWADRGCVAIVSTLVDEGRCSASVSEPFPYLPGHAEFGDDIGIVIATLTVTDPAG